MMDLAVDIEELVDAYPKKRDKAFKASEVLALKDLIKSEEDLQLVKNAIEIKMEDCATSRLPRLAVLVMDCLKTPAVHKAKPTVTENAEPATSLYQTEDNSKELEKAFFQIWGSWPRNPDYVERRQPALAAFLSSAKVFPRESLQSACKSYSDSFGDGPNTTTYAKTLKNFLLDKELVEHWIELSSKKDDRQEDKAFFEVAYAWFPRFTNKESSKTKEASWVHYWRKVLPEERLEFLAACRCYRQKRRSAWREEGKEVTMDDIAKYTRSFVSFVSEWKEAIKGDIFGVADIVEAKHDMVGNFLIKCLKESGLDVVNIWGSNEPGPFFTHMAMRYCYNKGMTIKEALVYMLRQAPKVVEDSLKATDRISKMANEELAKQQMSGYDADALAALVYQKILDAKLLEKPRAAVAE